MPSTERRLFPTAYRRTPYHAPDIFETQQQEDFQQQMANVLTDPPFAANPPIKLNVNAKVLGLVIGILAVIAAVIDLIYLPTVFALNNAVNSLNQFCQAYGT